MTDAQIIIALGDVTKLAGLLGKPPSTIANWKERGIPWQMRPLVQTHAKRKKIALPDKFLFEKGKRDTPKPEGE